MAGKEQSVTTACLHNRRLGLLPGHAVGSIENLSQARALKEAMRIEHPNPAPS